MDFLMAAMDFTVEDHEGDHHHQGGGFEESSTKMMMMMIKKEDEMKILKKKDVKGFGGVELDEGDDDHHQGRFQETTKTMIKKRPLDDDDEGSSCHDKKKKQKKRKKARCLQYPTPMPEKDLPIKFRKRITALGGSDVALVIQKFLFKTDVSSGHNRLSIPFNQIRQNFLTPQETEMLNNNNNNQIKKKRSCAEMEVMLIEPSLHRDTISLRKWEMKKDSGNSTSMYVLVGNWNSVAYRNALREDETVQLWSFRINTKLCFALVKRRATTGSCSFLFGSSSTANAEESVPIQ